jgi:hypothetical protein
VAVSATDWFRRREARTVLLAVFLLLNACGFVPDPTLAPPPTEQEAIAFLDELVALAQAGDLGGMCAVAGGGNCDEAADASGGPAAIPKNPPTLAGTRLIPSTTTGNNSGTVGGRLLVLCGTDGLRRPYRTEMLVSRFRGETYAINAVYWSGAKLAISNDTGGPSGGAGINCP